MVLTDAEGVLVCSDRCVINRIQGAETVESDDFIAVLQAWSDGHVRAQWVRLKFARELGSQLEMRGRTVNGALLELIRRR